MEGSKPACQGSAQHLGIAKEAKKNNSSKPRLVADDQLARVSLADGLDINLGFG